jgi:DNA-binding transcriptional regulator YiaG
MQRREPVFNALTVDSLLCLSRNQAMYFFDVTGRQIHDARELLGLTRNELGARCGVSRLTLRLWEANGDEPPNALAPNLRRVLRYLQSEGVAFLPDGTVRLQRAAPVAGTVIHSEAAA